MSATDKIIGYQSIKDELRNLLYITKHPEEFQEACLPVPCGLLLHGDEGLGKCFMADMFMAESDRIIFRIDQSDLSEDEVGSLGTFVNEMRTYHKYLLFIRNFDAIAADPSNPLTDILRSLREDVERYDVFFLGTAKDISDVPSDFLCEDFFDRTIHVDTPSRSDSISMIEHILKEMRIEPGISAEDIAGMVADNSYREIKRFLGTAALAMKMDEIRDTHTTKQGKKTATLTRSRDRIMRRQLADSSHPGREAGDATDTNIETSKPTFLHFLVDCWNRRECDLSDYPETDNEQARLRAAYHEAGHVVVGEVLKPGIMGYASICLIDNSEYTGVTSRRNNLSNLMHQAMIALGGRTATSVMFGENDDGAESDLARALHFIRKQIADLGYAGVEHVPYHTEEDKLSDEFRTSQESAVYDLANDAIRQTEQLLEDNRSFLVQVADKLIRDGYILTSEIGNIREHCGAR